MDANDAIGNNTPLAVSGCYGLAEFYEDSDAGEDRGERHFALLPVMKKTKLGREDGGAVTHVTAAADKGGKPFAGVTRAWRRKPGRNRQESRAN